MRKILALCIAFLSFLSTAQTVESCEENTQKCTPIGEWRFSVALGAGVYTNPLHGGKNIPLVVIPYVSYYSDKFFLENTTIGYTFVDEPNWNLSVISQLNHEQAFFERWHPSNIFVTSAESSFINGEVAADSSKKQIDIQDVSHRDWAVDAGFLMNWYLTSYSEINLELLHDISNVYQGSLAKINYRKAMKLSMFKETGIEANLGITWESSHLIDYYYGIGPSDTNDTSLHYKAGSALSPYLSLALKKRLSSNWQCKVNLKRTFLPDSITDSPLVKTQFVDTVFVGVKYVF